jgi:zinc transport system substrate-binding protein
MYESVRPASARPAPSTIGRRGLLGVLGLGALAPVLAACGSDGGSGSSDKPVIVTGCYGLTYIAQKVAGDQAEVLSLAKPGVDPHDIELSVGEIAQLEKSDLIVTIPGFQAAVEDAIASKDLGDVQLSVGDVVTLLAGSGEDEHHHEDEESDAGGEEEHEEESGAYDPHFWNDPTLLAQVGEAIAERLGTITPDQAQTFTDNAAAATEELESLDAELKEAFDAVDGERAFVTSHTAFAYLAKRYGLEQIGITGIDPETEPSPKRLLELQQIIEDEGITTVFFETTASPKVAQTLADNVGVQTAELDNLETQLSEDTDYPAVMRENCQALVASWT